MSTASATVLSTLNILRDTQRFIEDFSVPPQPLTLPAVTLRVRLPDPPSLYPHLIAIGAKEMIANEMNRVYKVRALELRSHYESSISNAFVEVTHIPFPRHVKERILNTFTNLYLTSVKSWIEECVDACNHRKPARQMASDDGLSRNTSARRTFNTDYIPLLEHFFNENSFPTQADKVFLAKKSGMTYRQIHVWFQNRRNRAKILRGSGKKRPAREGATLPLDRRTRTAKHTVCEKQPSAIMFQTSSCPKPRRECHLPETVAHRTIPHTDDINVLDECTGPPHAFPSPYPSTCTYQPFSIESRGRVFSECSWQRLPNHDSLLSQFRKIDVHELADQFSLLSVRDLHSQTSPSDSGLLADTLAATSSITVIPPPAPHPALVKSKEPVSSFAPSSQFPVVRASQPTSLVFTGSTMSAIRTFPRSPCEDSPRKISPLPKRYPRHSPLLCRNVTPPTPNSSSPEPSCSLSDCRDFEKETLSLASCPDPLTSRLWSLQPGVCAVT